MTERAAVYGGIVHAGPRPAGGWRVTASLPLPAPGDAENSRRDSPATRERP